MRKKTVGALAGAAAAAVALGSGGTFALWSDSESINAGYIQAGNLDVAPQGSFEWFDFTLNDSPGVIGTIYDFIFPRADWAHPILNMDGSYRVVPGDVVAGYQTMVVDLHGDNLRAHLSVGPGPGVPGSEFEGLDVEYGVYNVDNGTWIATGLEFDDVTNLALQDDGVGQEAGELEDPPLLPGWQVLPRNTELAIVVVAAFDASVAGQTSVNDWTALTNLEISLEQSVSASPIFD